MLRANLQLTNDLGNVGKPGKPKTTVPIVIYTAFDAEKAEELRKRLETVIHPVNRPSLAQTPKVADRPSQTQAPVAKPATKDQQAQISSEPRVADFRQDIKGESEIFAPDLEIAWSSEHPYLGMNAAELSYYTSTQQDEFVREVAVSLQHQQFILAYLEDPKAYLKSFDKYGWDEESDEAAEEFIQWYVARFRAELERQREIEWSGGVQSDIEYWIRDVANDERESVIVYDLEAGETLFVRYGDKDSVTLQEWQQKLAEGRNIVVIHNHPNNTGASLADFSTAAWLNAEYMLVVNPDGTQHRYALEGDEMVALEPVHNPDYVAPADPVETLAADLTYLMQTWGEIGNPPERVMLQEPNEDEITINTDSRLVDEFFLNPATIVFLEDVANEYEVDDPLLHNAMVYTIIYRELQDPLGFGLPNADNPAYQSNWDFVKSFLSGIPRILQRPIGKFDEDPSLGIGAISRLALFRIERDAREQGIDIYAPLLGYDIPATLSEVPFSEGVHERTAISARTLHYVNIEYNNRKYPTRVIPPSNEEVGAWRIELAEFTETDKEELFSGRVGGSIQQLYEPTLGIIAAEVALAMQESNYLELTTDEERIAYLIGYHANRSAEPPEKLYNPQEFRSDTHREIGWAEIFEELVDEHRREIKRRTQEK